MPTGTDNYYPRTILITSQSTWMYTEDTGQGRKKTTVFGASKGIPNPDYGVEVTMWEMRLPVK